MCETSAEKSPVIILGMHRSGTSLLTGTLEAFGLVTGPVNTAAPHNQLGNREHEAIRSLNVDILAHNGMTWKTAPQTHESLSWTDDHVGRAKELVAPLQSTERLWGFKDPRTLWTLDFWLSLFPKAYMIGIFRNPIAVAASLAARGGELHIPKTEGLEMWLRTNNRLMDVARKLDVPLIHFDPQNIDQSFAGPVMNQAKRLGLDAAQPQFFREDLVHQADASGPLSPTISSLYDALKRHADPSA